MSVWVLLRGLTREARHWGGFPQQLSATLGGARVVCLDLPGNGGLNRLASPVRVEAMADYCHHALAAAGIQPPCRVLAMSLGAMVAVAWAQRHPRDIAAAVLINTSLRPFSPFHERLRPACYPSLLRMLWPGTGDRALEAAIFRLTVASAGTAPDVVEEWLQWRQANPVTRRNALRQLLAAVRFRAPAAAPCRRMLLLAGAGDALVAPDCSRTLARQWNLPLVMHPSAGHDLPQADGTWVVEQVRCWAQRLDSPSHGEEVAAAAACNSGATGT